MNKKTQNKKSIIIFLLIVLLLLFSLSFLFYYFNIKEKIYTLSLQNEQTSERLKLCIDEKEELNKRINEMSIEIKKLNEEMKRIQDDKKELERKVSTLENENFDLHKKLEEKINENKNLSNSLTNIKQILQNFEKELYEKIDLIDNYKKEVENALRWYTENSRFYRSNDVKVNNIVSNLKESLKNKCIRIGTEECTIKIGCIFLVNSEYQDFSYKKDETIKVIDRILSLEEFLVNKGGDCEDYALFFKAEFNYLKELCKDKKIILETYEFDKERLEKNDKYFLDVNNKWYLEYSRKVELNNTNLVVICGNMYDLNEKKISGHCMVALTKERINSVNDIEFLLNAEVLEPQTSEFQGIIGVDFKLAGFDVINKEESYINSIITDDDFYIFSERYGRWLSLKNLHAELENSEQKFLEMFIYLKMQ